MRVLILGRGHLIRGFRILGWSVLLAGGSPRVVAGQHGPVRSDWGPFYSLVEEPNGNLSRRALGPLVERTESGAGHQFWAVRPLASRIADAAVRRSRSEVLWPLSIGRRQDDQSSLRVLTGWFVNYDVHDPDSHYRAWVVPFYYQGRDQEGQNYRALFPLGGSIKEFLGRDDITFALFPLWNRTTYEDLVTTHIVWPLFKRGVSEEIDRIRIFPLYQHNRINDQYRKTSILWPIWNSVEYTYIENGGGGYIVFPLWGHIRLASEDTWYVAPPLFRVTAGETLNRWYVPYPFLQFSTGEIEKAYIMPLWGTKTMGGSTRLFLLWPLYWDLRIDRGDALTRRTFLVPFFMTTVRERSPAPDQDGEVRRRNIHLWPVFSYRREGSESVTRAFDFALPSWRGPIERNYAPFWSLYVRTQVDDIRSEEFLWGLYRRYARGDQERYLSIFPLASVHRRKGEMEERSFSLLKGLVGYRRTVHGRSWRLLYVLDLGKKADPL